MRHSWKGWLAAGLAVAVLATVRPAPAAAPYAGSWAVTVLSNNQEINVWLLKIEDKDGKPDVQVIGGIQPPFKEAKVSKVSADAKALRFTLNARNTDFALTVHYPADKTKDLRGSVQINDNVEGVILKPTEQTEIDPMKAVQPVAGFDEVKKALGEKDTKQRRAMFRELIEKNPGKPIELTAAQMLVQSAVNQGGTDEEVKSAADQFVKAAGTYGPAMQQNAALQVARGILPMREPKLALEYARKAAALLEEGDPASRKAAVLKTLAGALKKAGKKDEVKEVDARLAKLEEALDQEFITNAVPFKTEPFAGRKGKSDRVAVVELFTGAQCPPCVSADIAFDAALKAYKPSDAVFLQYHLHIPGPDALTNSDTEARQNYYGGEIQGTPTMFLDGKTTPPMGGFRPHGKERFDKLSELIKEELEKGPGAQVKVNAQRKGDKVELVADVTDVQKPGDKVRLRFVVVEDVARYAGRNGQRLHHHVVRAFPGGVEGKALKEKAAKVSASFSLADLKKSLNEYLEKHNFSEEDRPMKLDNLKVVAFVQDDDSKAILQAVQVEVPGAKE
jgi:hypothetical protein